MALFLKLSGNLLGRCEAKLSKNWMKLERTSTEMAESKFYWKTTKRRPIIFSIDLEITGFRGAPWRDGIMVAGHWSTGARTTWLINMFEKMGEDPESNSYLKPSDSDVWRFIANIKRWLTDPDRKGIP